MTTRARALTLAIAVVASGLAGCGKPKQKATKTPTAATDGSGGSSDASSLPAFDISGDDVASRDAKTVGATKENPVPTCGAEHSYDYIASDVTCADGRSALGGDLEAAMSTRVGSVGATEDMHIIDLYEIHCPEGPKQVYVDMYDCENARPTRGQLELDRLITGVARGEYDDFIRRCREESGRGGGGRISTLLKACVPAMPAVLGAAGDPAGARAWLKEWCLGAPLEPRDGDPPRFLYLDNVLSTEVELSQSKGVAAAEAASQRAKRTDEYARICELDRAAFERWRTQRRREE